LAWPVRFSTVHSGRNGALARRLGLSRHSGGRDRIERHDPALLAERLRPPIQRGQPLTNKLLMGAFLPLWWFVLMGLDRRFGWSSLPVALEILGAVLLCLGIWLSFEVLKENSYAAPVVKDRRSAGTPWCAPGPMLMCAIRPMLMCAILCVRACC